MADEYEGDLDPQVREAAREGLEEKSAWDLQVEGRFLRGYTGPVRVVTLLLDAAPDFTIVAFDKVVQRHVEAILDPDSDPDIPF